MRTNIRKLGKAARKSILLTYSETRNKTWVSTHKYRQHNLVNKLRFKASTVATSSRREQGKIDLNMHWTTLKMKAPLPTSEKPRWIENSAWAYQTKCLLNRQRTKHDSTPSNLRWTKELLVVYKVKSGDWDETSRSVTPTDFQEISNNAPEARDGNFGLGIFYANH